MRDENDEFKRLPPLTENSLINRRLRSFPDGPNLDVVVGENQRVYRHNEIILASYSLYVDAMLSSPVKEKETKRISFPDIKPETWEKMLRYLEPGAAAVVPSLEDIKLLLPLYDKYQFIDGIRYFDIFLMNYFVQVIDYSDIVVDLAVLSFNLDLPVSKVQAQKFAVERLSRLNCWENAEHIRKLLPLVENNEDLLVSLGKLIKGRACREMTLEEIRSVTKADDFPEKCAERAKQVQEIEGTMRMLKLKSLCLHHSDASLCGTYERRERSYSAHRLDPGALRYRYRQKRSSNDNWFNVIEAMDVFGNVWEISELRIRDDEEEDGDDDNEEALDNVLQRRVLFRWESGFSSLLPPKHGWKAVDSDIPEDNNTEDDTFHLNYTIHRNEYAY